MNKKAQGLSITTIVVAAIAIVVLVVLVLVFTGKIGWFRTTSNNCVVNGGTCVDKGDCSGGRVISGYSCGKDTKQVCCFNAGNSKAPQSS